MRDTAVELGTSAVARGRRDVRSIGPHLRQPAQRRWLHPSTASPSSVEAKVRVIRGLLEQRQSSDSRMLLIIPTRREVRSSAVDIPLSSTVNSVRGGTHFAAA
jgi:hypothetical protein